MCENKKFPHLERGSDSTPYDFQPPSEAAAFAGAAIDTPWKSKMSKIAGYDSRNDGPGFVGIRFCQECNNMLYPKEDKENKVLMYAVSKERSPSHEIFGRPRDDIICIIFIRTKTAESPIGHPNRDCSLPRS